MVFWILRPSTVECWPAPASSLPSLMAATSAESEANQDIIRSSFFTRVSAWVRRNKGMSPGKQGAPVVGFGEARGTGHGARVRAG